MYDFDIIVIGTGPAGEKAAIKAAELGAKVAIVEKARAPGGAGINTGTIPSKAIRETILFVNQLKRKDLSGFDVRIEHQLSIQELFYRQQNVSQSMSYSLLQELQAQGITYFQGKARFLDTQSIELTKFSGDRLILKGTKFIIAVGASPYHPKDINFDDERVLDSDSILNLKEIPKSLSVYGGGVIGCEYATMFTRLGTEVYLISPKPNLLEFIDPDLSYAMNYIMLQSNIRLRLGEAYNKIETSSRGVKIHLQSGKEVVSDFLLYANGRQGNAADLGLEKCGVLCNNRQQLVVNENYQTEQENIYAVGDVIGFPSLASTGNEQGRCAAQHAVTGDSRSFNKANIPLAVYTIPEIAMVGYTEPQLTQQKVSYETGLCHFRSLARAKLVGEEDGMIKLIFHPKSLKLLGVHILGYHASDLIHIGQAVLHFGGPIDYFIEEVINFPTFSSGYKVAAQDGLSRMRAFSSFAAG